MELFTTVLNWHETDGFVSLWHV